MRYIRSRLSMFPPWAWRMVMAGGEMGQVRVSGEMCILKASCEIVCGPSAAFEFNQTRSFFCRCISKVMSMTMIRDTWSSVPNNIETSEIMCGRVQRGSCPNPNPKTDCLAYPQNTRTS